MGPKWLKNRWVTRSTSPLLKGDITLLITGDGAHFADCLWQMVGQFIRQKAVDVSHHIPFMNYRVYTPPETNIADIATENQWLEDEIIFGMAYFQVLC